jgi:DNA mismatch repair protein MutS
MDGVKNLSIAVKEWGDRVIFLRTIVEGGTNRSYGIEVARLAGVPGQVVSRAREVLGNLEKGELDEIGMPKIGRSTLSLRKPSMGQLDLFTGKESRLINELKEADVLEMTPLEALNRISAWQKLLKE